MKLEKLTKARIWYIGVFAVFLAFSALNVNAQNYGSEDELKKNANALFGDKDYVKALPLYSQLVSLYPSDPEYNYKYGTCLIFGDADKSKSLKYLKFASGKPNVDPKCYYFYARSLHLNYAFNDAIRYYEKFESTASSKDKKELKSARFIAMCKNGSNLLRSPNDVAVLGKQEIKRSDFFRVYSLEEIGGKIIVKPEQFKSKYDLKVGEYSIIHLPENATVLYYSSYGDNSENGKDIFRIRKLESGEWGTPENLGAPINTPYDEDFPFMHQQDNTLYFSSKGHNSMGGYDIFRSTYNESTGTWSNPVNMDFAISSADDDILFISNMENQIAYFASARYSLDQYIAVYKVLISKRPIQLSVVKGKFISEDDPNQKNAKITVMDPINEEELGVFYTDESSGEYTIKLPTNGGVVKFILETTDDAPIHTGKVTIPSLDQLQALKQELRLVGSGAQQKLVIKNFFDEENAEPIEAELIADMLRQKAQLDVNIDEEKAKELISQAGGGPTLVRSATNNENSAEENDEVASLSNAELVTNLQADIKQFEQDIKQREKQTNFGYQYTFRTANKADDLFSINEDILDDIADSPESEDRTSMEQALAENKKKANPLASEAIAGYGLSESLKNEVKENKLELRSLNESLAVLRSKVNSGNRDEAVKVFQEAKDKIQIARETSTTFKILPSTLREQYNQQQEQSDKTNDYYSSLKDEQTNLEQEILRNMEEVKTLKGKKKEAMTNQITAFELDLEDIGFEAENIGKKAKEEDRKARQLKTELELTNEIIEKIKANNSTSASLSSEESAELKKMIEYFKEQNLLDDILGEEQAAAIAINEGLNKRQATSDYHAPYDEEGKPVDYDAMYEAERQAAENITDEQERNDALAEVYKNWDKSITDDIEKKREQLESGASGQQRKSLEEEIASLESNQSDKREELLTYDPDAVQKQSYPTTELDVELSYSAEEMEQTGLALSPVTEDGASVDYASIYSEKLSEAEEIEEVSTREEKVAQLNQLWVETITSDINNQNAALTNALNAKEKAKIEETITKLEENKKEREEISEAFIASSSSLASNDQPTNNETESSSDQPTNTGIEDNSSQTNNDNSNNQETNVAAASNSTNEGSAENNAVDLTYSSLLNNPTKITTENGEIKNYSAVYAVEYEQALKDGDQAKAKEVVNAWELSTAEEIAQIKAELKRLQSPENRELLYGKLASLEVLKKVRKAAAAEGSSIPETDEQMQLYQNLVSNPASINNGDEVIAYDDFYEVQRTIAEEQGDNAQLSIIEENYSTSRSEHIALLENQRAAAADDDEIQSLDELIASLKEANRLADEAIAAEKGSTSSSREGKLSPVTPEGESVDYQNIYAQQMQETETVDDEFDRTFQQSAISENWLATISEDIDLKKQTLDNTKKNKERKKLEEMIAELEAYYANQKAMDDSIKQVLAALEPSSVEQQQAQLFSDEKLAIQYRLMDYQAENSGVAMATAGQKMLDVIDIEAEIERKQELMQNTDNAFEQERMLSDIQQLKARSETNQLEVASIFESMNKEEYELITSQLNTAAENASAEEKQQAESKQTEAKQQFEQATALREQAAATDTFEEKAKLLKEAYDMEVSAIRLMKEAAVIYEGSEAMIAQKGTTEETPNVEAVSNNSESSETTAPVQTTSTEDKAPEPLAVTQEEADEIEENEAFIEFTKNKDEVGRLMKSADVEYAKSADFQKESERQLALAVEKRKEAETLKKKKDRKKAIAEAEELERLSAINKLKADSIKVDADELASDAEQMDKQAMNQLKSASEDDQRFEQLLAYYQAKLAEVLEIREGQRAFASEPTQPPVAPTTSNIASLPTAAELTAEEFRKLDFTAIQEQVEKELFIKAESKNVSAYNAQKPIPIDEVKLPEGIIFKVQIGAFRNPIPQDLFKGFAPVNGERTSSGITRYTAGLFKAFATADQAKAEIRSLGYRDAFVVAFRNGVRIPISEARALMAGADPGDVANNETGVQIPTNGGGNGTASNGSTSPAPQETTSSANDEITAEAPDVRNVQGLFYTVQVGVYANTKIPGQLESIRPLNSERTDRNYIRYTSGQFATFEEAVGWRRQLVGRGIEDAFVTAYLNGNRISVGEARNYQPQE